MKRFVAIGAVVLAALAGAGVIAFVALRPAASASVRAVSVRVDADFPAPPVDATVFSRELGSDVLALAVAPRSGKTVLRASVLDEQGKGVRGLAVSFSAHGSSAHVVPCGDGCYQTTIPTAKRLRSVDLLVHGASVAGRWHVALPAQRQPAFAGTLVDRAARVWRSLRSLSYTEVLASDATHRVVSSWRVQSPDRIAYVVRGGQEGIVIGARRWDRAAPDAKWIASPQAPVTQPRSPWVSSVDADVVGDGSVAGRAVWRVTFFDPGTPAWFAVAIDKRSFRTLRLRMVTTAHFMSDAYGSFNATAPVQPPR